METVKTQQNKTIKTLKNNNNNVNNSNAGFQNCSANDASPLICLFVAVFFFRYKKKKIENT